MRVISSKTFAACAAVAAFALASSANAQGVFKFQFSPGMKLLYETRFSQTVETKTSTETLTSKSTVAQVRQWKVDGVDGLGVASLELTVLRMKLDRTEADGKTASYDSDDPRASDDTLRKMLSKSVGKPILRVQLAPSGVVKASQTLNEAKAIFPELPFQISVPDEYPRRGLKWQRDFAISLDPPLGKGEAHKAVQTCVMAECDDDRCVVEAETKLEAEAANPGARIALGQFLPTGKVTLDRKRGLMLKSEMAIERTVDDFDGPGSRYHYVSKATETLLDVPAETAAKEENRK
jgi:hypothetical protein